MDSLSSDLASFLRNSGESGDLTLVSCDGEVKVHRNILAARSPAFNAMLKNDMEEKISVHVEVKDFGKSIVEAMVQFVYTAQIDENFKDLVELLKIGHKYLIKSLVEECSKGLAREMSKDNVLELGGLAETYSVEDLLKSCAEFVLDNMEVLGDDWEKHLKDCPMFLMSIVRSMKDDSRVKEDNVKILRVSRFGHEERLQNKSLYMVCCGVKHDAITIKLSKAATLTSVGMFGCMVGLTPLGSVTSNTTREIPITVEILDTEQASIICTKTSYKSSGSSEPVLVPVNVEMDANKEYTVQVLVNCPLAIYCGAGGKAEVNYDNQLTVQFKNSPKSTTGTNVEYGQIPELCFQLL